MKPIRRAWKQLAVSTAIATVAIGIGPIASESTGAVAAGIRITRLTTDWAAKPLAINHQRPLLAWILQSSGRNQIQTAYQVEVASRRRLLESGDADIWGSGKVATERSIGVRYGGPWLRAGSRYYWRVRVWDREGFPSAWSDTAWWQMDPLARNDWQARWIAPPAPPTPSFNWRNYTIALDLTVLNMAGGVVFRARNYDNLYYWKFAADGTNQVRLRKYLKQDGHFTVLGEVPIMGIDISTTNHVEIELNGPSVRTSLNGAVVDTTLDNSLSKGTFGLTTEPPKETALFDNVLVTGPTGSVLAEERFDDPLHNPFSTGSVKEGHLELTGKSVALYQTRTPFDSPMLRNEFRINHHVERATAIAYGLGWYELYLNGRRVSDRKLAPAATRFKERALYDVYDVTEHLDVGRNAAGLWLGNGYGPTYSADGWKWNGRKRAILQVYITFSNGQTRIIGTGRKWRSLSQSPIVENDIYDGEMYDARKEIRNWSEPRFDDQDWRRVDIVKPPTNTFQPNTAAPIRAIKTLHPSSLTEPEPGVFVYDMGQVITGWVRLRVRGPRGAIVQLRHSVDVSPTGMIDPWTNRNAAATDTYILRGSSRSEVYQPRFTYHGFRYVEVTGYPGRPRLDSVRARVLGADLERTGWFKSSSEILNRLHSNIVWTLRGNNMSFPTDTPVRDERTPAQMDVLTSHPASIAIFDMLRYYLKWLADTKGFDWRNPDWSGQQVMVPWSLYASYGDIDALREHYPNMKRYVIWLGDRSPEYTLSGGYGDWVAPPPVPDPGPSWDWDDHFNDEAVVNSALYFECARIVAQAAAEIGFTSDARRFRRLSTRIKNSFNEHFLNGDGTYADGGQTPSILALAYNLVPKEQRQSITDALVNDIVENHMGHLSTGIFGTRYFLEALSNSIQETDIALNALTTPTYPSFGYQIALGATTLWEQWPEQVAMQSHDHAMFAGIGSSFYTTLAGIRPLLPGYKRILFKPTISSLLTHVRARVTTVHGSVLSAWRVLPDKSIALRVVVPVNTMGRVVVPEGFVGIDPQFAGNTVGIRQKAYSRRWQPSPNLTIGSGSYRYRFFPAPLRSSPQKEQINRLS